MRRPVLVQGVTQGVRFVLRLLRSRLLPCRRSRMRYVLNVVDLRKVMRLRSIFLRARSIRLLIIRVHVRLIMSAHRTTLIRVIPRQLRSEDRTRVLRIIFCRRLRVLISQRGNRRVRVQLRPMRSNVTITTHRNVLVRRNRIFLIRFLSECRRSEHVSVSARLLVTTLRRFTFTRDLSRINYCQCATFCNMEFMCRLILNFTVCGQRTRYVLTRASNRSYLLYSFLAGCLRYHYL